MYKENVSNKSENGLGFGLSELRDSQRSDGWISVRQDVYLKTCGFLKYEVCFLII